VRRGRQRGATVRPASADVFALFSEVSLPDFLTLNTVMVQGIKIKDSDSRKEAKRRLKALRAQQALELMQTD